MRIKTIVALIIVVLLTIVIMQNTGQVQFNLLFASIYIPKLVMLTAASVAGFILGVLVARPRKLKIDSKQFYETNEQRKNTGTLSDEDKDYIS